MRSSIVKRSVIIGGHKTSVSLEQAFWDAVREIAAQRQISVSTLLHEIDSAREQANLSSAIRVFVFEHYRALSRSKGPHHQGGQSPATFVFGDAALC